MHALGPLLAKGEIDVARRGLEAAGRVARRLRQPAHLWDVGGAEAMLAISDGELDEGGVLAEKARVIGERIQAEMATPVYLMQRYTLCDLRGGLESIEPSIARLVAEHPSRPVFRCALAYLHARVGRPREAAVALEALARDRVSALPFDQEWLLGMSFLAETATLVGDLGAAAALLERLAPWAALNVVDQCEGMRGSVSRYVAILAAALGRPDEAGRHFEAALEMDAAMGARPWLARTQLDYARWLESHGGDEERAGALAEAARASLRALGLPEIYSRSPSG